MGYVDLHTHTNYSDGTFSVSELIELAVKKNISTISVTDHDNIIGLSEAYNISQKNNINLINGVELSATYNGSEVHILAYNFDRNSKDLINFLEYAKSLRVERNKKIFEKLNNIGIKIDREKLISSKDSVVTRADIATEICNLGFAKTPNDAFFKYIARNKLCYVDKNSPDVQEVLKLINDIGAISSLAHPKAYPFFNVNFKNSLKELKKLGLQALECYHSSYSVYEKDVILSLANRLDFLKTGGSDFHGDKKQDVHLGETTNSKMISEDMVIDFLNITKIRRLNE